MYTSHSRHEGQAVDPRVLSVLRVDARYRIVCAGEGAQPCTSTASPKDIAALDKRSVLAKVYSQGSGR